MKFLRSKRKQKQEQREQEAAKIIGLGERTKTIIANQAKVCSLFHVAEPILCDHCCKCIEMSRLTIPFGHHGKRVVVPIMYYSY